MQRLKVFIIYVMIIVIVFVGSNFGIKYIMNNFENDAKVEIKLPDKIETNIENINDSETFIGLLLTYMILF